MPDCTIRESYLKEQNTVYRESLAGSKFGESSVIRQTKTIQIFTYNYNLLAASIHSPNFFSPNARNE